MAQGDGEEVIRAIERVVSATRTLHDNIIKASGGTLGEDAAKLFSALSRPFQTWDGVELFPSALEKAAVALHGIICGHAFADGNKRTGVLIAAVFLTELGHLDGDVTQDQIRNMEPVALAAAQPGGVPVEIIVVELEKLFGQKR